MVCERIMFFDKLVLTLRKKYVFLHFVSWSRSSAG